MVEQKLGVVACMPCAGDINPYAAKRFFSEMSEKLVTNGIPIMRLDPSVNSNLCHNFNQCLCFALNLRDKGLATHFAMQHSDLAPGMWWLDTLWEEMQKTGAHWMSAVAPIKLGHGITSTGISQGNVWNPWCRLTMKEIYNPDLPETFCINDLGEQSDQLGYYLLNNTGCMLIDLRPEWWKRSQVGEGGLHESLLYFDTRNRVVYIEGKGWEAVTEPEDWHLSRMMYSVGAKVYATRKVEISHFGSGCFDNKSAWGDWEHDMVGGRAIQRVKEEEENKRQAEAKETIEKLLAARGLAPIVEVPKANAEPSPIESKGNESPIDLFDEGQSESQRVCSAPKQDISFDVYTVAYNEEEMLPHFLKHYSFARRIVIYDNESTDRTVEIVKQDPKVIVRAFNTGGLYDEKAQTEIRNNCWRESGADYVIVCDVDEFIDVRSVEAYGKKEVAFKCEGHNMVGVDGESISDMRSMITHGTNTTEMRYNKISVFSPRIAEINYTPGMHTANPTCPVITEVRPILRHYLHLGEEYTIRRYKNRNTRMSDENIRQGLGFQYAMSEDVIRAEHQFLLANSVEDSSL